MRPDFPAVILNCWQFFMKKILRSGPGGKSLFILPHARSGGIIQSNLQAEEEEGFQ